MIEQYGFWMTPTALNAHSMMCFLTGVLFVLMVQLWIEVYKKYKNIRQQIK